MSKHVPVNICLNASAGWDIYGPWSCYLCSWCLMLLACKSTRLSALCLTEVPTLSKIRGLTLPFWLMLSTGHCSTSKSLIGSAYARFLGVHTTSNPEYGDILKVSNPFFEQQVYVHSLDADSITKLTVRRNQSEWLHLLLCIEVCS